MAEEMDAEAVLLLQAAVVASPAASSAAINDPPVDGWPSVDGWPLVDVDGSAANAAGNPVVAATTPPAAPKRQRYTTKKSPAPCLECPEENMATVGLGKRGRKAKPGPEVNANPKAKTAKTTADSSGPGTVPLSAAGGHGEGAGGGLRGGGSTLPPPSAAGGDGDDASAIAGAPTKLPEKIYQSVYGKAYRKKRNTLKQDGVPLAERLALAQAAGKKAVNDNILELKAAAAVTLARAEVPEQAETESAETDSAITAGEPLPYAGPPVSLSPSAAGDPAGTESAEAVAGPRLGEQA